MDTKRALIVIMILLLLINITLASYIIVSTDSNETVDSMFYTIEILKQRNITVNCKIPEIIIEASSVIIGNNKFTMQSVSSIKNKVGGEYYFNEAGLLIYDSTSTEIVISGEVNRTDVEDAAKEFIEAIGLNKTEFILDFIREESKDAYNLKFTFEDKNGVDYYDSYIEMHITKYGVETAGINVLDIISGPEPGGSGLPISTILLANLIPNDNKSLAINSISTGYHRRKIYGSESVMSWRIRFDDGSERFFDAGTGREIVSVLEVLKLNRIIFKCLIPDYIVEAAEIEYGPNTFDQQAVAGLRETIEGEFSFNGDGVLAFNKIITNGTPAVDDINENIAGEKAEEFIEALGLAKADYVLDKLETNEENSYLLRYIYKDESDILYFDNYMDFTVNKYGVVDAAIKNNSFSPGTDYELGSMPIGTIMLNNLKPGLNEEYTIISIIPGFRKNSKEDNKAVLCWRIRFEDGSERFFNASYGQEVF